MSPSGVRRRLATVLFVDIVASTAIATDLGDARWRVVLARFRQVVRRELKRHGGHEQDTAGDGFFATFGEPGQALRCAAAIAAAVQELGLDVRAGVHTGECEEIDGKLGGIAVHIAARIMATAGAAEVMTTGTAKDLVIGSSAAFEDRGTCELKGVEGRWNVYRLRSIEVDLPLPLDPEVAAERLSAVAGVVTRRRRRSLAAIALALALVAAAAVVIVAHTGRASAAPPTLLRIDPRTNRVAAEVRDKEAGCLCGPILWVVDGTLWEQTGVGRTLATRSLDTGKQLRTFDLPPQARGFTIGFGALWIVLPGTRRCPRCALSPNTIERIDELSGRIVSKIRFGGEFAGGIATDKSSVWLLNRDGTLIQIDPASNRLTGRFATGATETYIFGTGAGYQWICECIFNDVNVLLRYDATAHTAKAFQMVRHSPPSAKPSTYRPRTFVIGLDHSGLLWLLFNGTTAPWDPRRGWQAAGAIGLAGDPVQAVLARGSIWVAAGSVVDRVYLNDGTRVTIELPAATYASGIAVDPVTNAVWVATSAAPAT